MKVLFISLFLIFQINIKLTYASDFKTDSSKIVFIEKEFDRIKDQSKIACCKSDTKCLTHFVSVKLKIDEDNWSDVDSFYLQNNTITIPQERLFKVQTRNLISRSLYHEFGHVCINEKKLIPEQMMSSQFASKLDLDNPFRHACLVSVLNDFFISFKSSSFTVRPDIWVEEIFADSVFADLMKSELGSNAYPDGYIDEEHIPPQYYRHCLK